MRKLHPLESTSVYAIKKNSYFCHLKTSSTVCFTITVIGHAEQLEELEALQAIMGEDISVDMDARSCEVLLDKLVSGGVAKRLGRPLNAAGVAAIQDGPQPDTSGQTTGKLSQQGGAPHGAGCPAPAAGDAVLVAGAACLALPCRGGHAVFLDCLAAGARPCPGAAAGSSRHR